MAKRQTFSLDDAAVNTSPSPEINSKTEINKARAKDSTAIKRLTLDMPASLHRKLKIMAIENDTAMAEMVREWIEQRVSSS